jgi:O-antigen/teichoic acid export membrane protein
MAAAAQIKGSRTGLLVHRESIRTRLARNTLWFTSGSAFSQALSLLTAIVVGRMLGVSRFGQLALVQSTVMMIGTFGEMGATLTTTKFVSSWRVVDPKRSGRLIGFSLLATAASGLALMLVLGGLPSYIQIDGLAGLSHEMQAACGLLLFDMLNRIQFGALAGLEAFASSAQVQLARGLLTLPCVWLGTRWGGLLGAISAFGLVSFITFAIGHQVLRSKCRSMSIPLTYRTGVQPEIISTSLSLWISSLLLTGSAWLVTVLLSRHSLSQVGLYNAADRWKTALLFLPQMLFQVILPMLSHTQAGGDYRACRHIVHATFASTIAITGMAAIGVLALSKPLMASYGQAFVDGAGVLSLAALAAVASSIYTVGSGALWALGKPGAMLRIDIAKTAVLLGLCWLGYAGSAWKLMLANVFTFTVGSVIVMVAVYRQLECPKL